MIYGIIGLVTLGLIHFLKRSISLSLVVMMASSLLADLVAKDITNLMMGLAVNWSKTTMMNLVRMVMILLPALIVLMRAPKCNRDLLFKIIDSALLMITMIVLSGAALVSLIELDDLSLQIRDLIIQNSKWLLIGAGLYGFYGLLKKPDEA